jgi:hypothetical protein
MRGLQNRSAAVLLSRVGSTPMRLRQVQKWQNALEELGELFVNARRYVAMEVQSDSDGGMPQHLLDDFRV